LVEIASDRAGRAAAQEKIKVGRVAMTDLAADDAAKIAEAVEWLGCTAHGERQGATLPALRRIFGLSTKAAIEAIRQHAARMAARRP
jgi:hypothetical protein